MGYTSLFFNTLLSGIESAARTIGHINFDTKLTGKRSAGNPHAAFDEAVAGIGLKYRARPRPYLREPRGEIPRGYSHLLA